MKELTDDLLELIADRFKAMSNPVRLKILNVLQDGELSVTEILRRVGGSQANVSKHLNVLRSASLVAPRREGVNIYYRIADAMVIEICNTVCDALFDQISAEAEKIALAREHARDLTSP